MVVVNVDNKRKTEAEEKTRGEIQGNEVYKTLK